MKPRLLFLFFLLLFSFTFYPQAFSKYAELVGKRVEIHGPYCWDTLGVALDKKSCDYLKETLQPKNKKMFSAMLSSYKILRIIKNTKVLVLEAEVIDGKARVIILTGIYKGMSGWIPIEWLNGNEVLPSFKDAAKL